MLHRNQEFSLNLTIQYRCPKIIAEILSKLFYGGRIKTEYKANYNKLNLNKIEAVNIDSIETYDKKHNSYYNHKEIDFIISFLGYLHMHDISNDDIGIIVFYQYIVNFYIDRK